jgi:predicted NAD/FAD-dependent oxidoreductase
MSAPIKQMAIGQSTRFSSQVVQIEKSDSKWQLVLDQRELIQVDIVVVATPAEQAGALLASAAPDFAARAAAIRSTPCWTTMLAFAGPLALDQDCLRGDDKDALAWAARNSAKPGRTGPEAWVLQASPDWSRAHLEADAGWVTTALSAVFSQRLGTALPPPIASVSHRWRYANALGQTSSLAWDAERRIGLCGDWLGGGCVEAAWLSGTRLAAQIASSLPTGLPQHSSIPG